VRECAGGRARARAHVEEVAHEGDAIGEARLTQPQPARAAEQDDGETVGYGLLGHAREDRVRDRDRAQREPRRHAVLVRAVARAAQRDAEAKHVCRREARRGPADGGDVHVRAEHEHRQVGDLHAAAGCEAASGRRAGARAGGRAARAFHARTWLRVLWKPKLVAQMATLYAATVGVP
jgi:hypothetical protein